MDVRMTPRLNGAVIVAFCLAVFAAIPAAANPPMLTHLKVAVGQKAPDFALPAGNGKTVRLSSLAGHNVLIYFYRGSW